MAIFPLDITGSATSNRITNEIIPIVPASEDITGPSAYVLLQYAPAFAQNFVISHNGTPLVRGQHYDFIGQNIHASKYIGKDLYAGVFFFNNNISGNVTVSYNTLGDTWVQNNYQHIATYFNTYFSQQMTNWDKVFGVPYQLPPIVHPEPIDSLKGMDDIVAVLEEIKTAVESTDYTTVQGSIIALSQALVNHVALENPHNATKSNFDLGNVGNYTSLNAPAQSFSGTTRYLTGGTITGWKIIQDALFQHLAALVSTDPLSSNNVLFTTTSHYTGIAPPTGLNTSDIVRLVILQIRLPENDAQRTVILPNIRRLQIGFAVCTDATKSFALVRELPPFATGTHNWAVLPSWASLVPLLP